MTLSRFDPGLTSKTLNLFFLRFNEQFESENLGKELAKVNNIAMRVQESIWYEFVR